MPFKTDTGGLALTADVKLSNKSTTWNTRLQHIGENDCLVTIVSFSLADVEYISRILSRRKTGRNLRLICNTRACVNAVRLKKEFPEMRVYLHPMAHAKLVLIEPEMVWVSSENIGHKLKSFDATIGIMGKEAYDHYAEQIDSLLRSSNTIEITEEFINE